MHPNQDAMLTSEGTRFCSFFVDRCLVQRQIYVRCKRYVTSLFVVNCRRFWPNWIWNRQPTLSTQFEVSRDTTVSNAVRFYLETCNPLSGLRFLEKSVVWCGVKFCDRVGLDEGNKSSQWSCESVSAVPILRNQTPFSRISLFFQWRIGHKCHYISAHDCFNFMGKFSLSGAWPMAPSTSHKTSILL